MEKEKWRKNCSKRKAVKSSTEVARGTGQKLQQKEEEQQDKQYKAGYSHEMTGKEPHYEKVK